jgi:signal transduction histidine kinase
VIDLQTTRLRQIEWWMSWIRVVGVVFAVVELSLVTQDWADGYKRLAWATTAALAVGTGVLFALARRRWSLRGQRLLSAAALLFDTAVVVGYVFVFAFEPGTQVRQLLFFPVVEAALRFGLAGGIAMPVLLLPVLVAFEEFRSARYAPREYIADNVTFPFGVELILGLIVGWLVHRLGRETESAQERAIEAERLRDQLGRRVDVLEAASRVARALGSSLESNEAFGAFIRELRGLVPFDRVAIVLDDGGSLRVLAAAGEGAEDTWEPGTQLPIGSLAREMLAGGQTVYRADMTADEEAEESELVRLGLRSRVAAPILLGPRATGILGVVRREPNAFRPDEIELVTLLGRLVGTAVQNMRAYEAERNTVEELRRLSALRADFVSLVSHELRSPMAAVIGSARTLQQRWRNLSPEQRESFLALIADETTRLAHLIGDVLDTSRIEAGTFSYSFTNVDVSQLLRDVAAAAELAQDEVRVSAEMAEPLPPVRGDKERLRQVLTNLVENAVKYTPAGGEVAVRALREDGYVRIEVRDQGPGIAAEHQRVIFEKFGRANVAGANAKPGTGLGLFIARSITEAHGGTLDVHSSPERGATFTLSLPTGNTSA